MKKLTIVLILAILIAGCLRVPEESCMSVEFLQDDEKILFQNSPAADVENPSISFWAYFDTAHGSTVRTIFHQYKSDNAASSYYIGHTSGEIHVILRDSAPPANPKLSISDGGWTGSWKHVVIVPKWDSDYSRVYINAVEAGYTTNETDVITRETESGGDISIGGPRSGSGYSIDGQLQDIRIYNRVLSQTEIATLYNSRCQRVVMNGLVFWAPLTGASGTQSFDGLQLSYENIIPDVIGGAQGFPYGGPVGRASTIQTIGGQ